MIAVSYTHLVFIIDLLGKSDVFIHIYDPGYPFIRAYIIIYVGYGLFCLRNGISAVSYTHLVNGHVDNAVSGIDYGAGIRIFNGTNAVYVYTNDLSEDNLIKTAEQAAEASVGKSAVRFPSFNPYKYENRNLIKIMPSDRSGREKRDILKEASDAAFGYNSLIKQVRTGCCLLYTSYQVPFLF